MPNQKNAVYSWDLCVKTSSADCWILCDRKQLHCQKVILINFATKCSKSYNFVSQPSPKVMHTRFNIALLKILFAYVSLKLSHLLTLIQVQSHHFLPLLFSQIEPNSSEKPALRKKEVNCNLDHMFPDQLHAFQYFLALLSLLILIFSDYWYTFSYAKICYRSKWNL